MFTAIIKSGKRAKSLRRGGGDNYWVIQNTVGSQFMDNEESSQNTTFFDVQYIERQSSLILNSVIM